MLPLVASSGSGLLLSGPVVERLDPVQVLALGQVLVGLMSCAFGLLGYAGVRGAWPDSRQGGVVSHRATELRSKAPAVLGPCAMAVHHWRCFELVAATSDSRAGGAGEAGGTRQGTVATVAGDSGRGAPARRCIGVQVHDVLCYAALWGGLGVVQGSQYPACLRVLGAWFRKGERGVVLGAWGACSSLGNMAGAGQAVAAQLIARSLGGEGAPFWPVVAFWAGTCRRAAPHAAVSLRAMPSSTSTMNGRTDR